VWGEDRVGRIGHWLAALALFAGSWLSGYFIVATNAFMQHPVGGQIGANGTMQLDGFWRFVLNPWAMLQYLHTMDASVVTASFVVAAVGAYYTLRGQHAESARSFLTVGVIAGLVASVIVAFPTGDRQAKAVAQWQPVALAAMEGRFESGPYAAITLIGQPDVQDRKLDNPVQVRGILSVLAFGAWHSNVPGLNAYATDQWPTNIELLYYAYHIMVGLGTLFILLMAASALRLARGRLSSTRWMLWMLMLAFPFPYIANTAGWLTAELGRQPWLVYGIMRTDNGASPMVHSGTVLFTTIGFAGLYLVLGLLFVFLIAREIMHGPQPAAEVSHV
jgi:cytochrome d ubiquinol oxidase subunit I